MTVVEGSREQRSRPLAVAGCAGGRAVACCGVFKKRMAGDKTDPKDDAKKDAAKDDKKGDDGKKDDEDEEKEESEEDIRAKMRKLQKP